MGKLRRTTHIDFRYTQGSTLAGATGQLAPQNRYWLLRTVWKKPGWLLKFLPYSLHILTQNLGQVHAIWQSCQPLRKNCICYESRKGIRKSESASKKYEYSASQKKERKQHKQCVYTNVHALQTSYGRPTCSKTVIRNLKSYVACMHATLLWITYLE